MTPLERQLEASVSYLSESKRQMNDRALATIESGPGLARVEPGELRFSPEQERMIRDAYAFGASESEFGVLLEIAKARRLNPLLKQCYFVKRWDSVKRREVWAIQVSIDGMRAIADRTHVYDGQDEAEFTYERDGTPAIARVRIYRKGISRPFVGIARWAECVQKTKEGNITHFWQQMGHTMLAKCAEANGLRKAFPEDTGGIYIPEEMMQAESGNERQLPIEQQSPRISPHGEPEDEPTVDDDAEYRRLSALLDGIAADLGKCESYSAATALRARLGSKASPAEAALTRDLQRAKEQNLVGFEQRKELASKWQSLDRSVSQLVEFERLRAEMAGIDSDLSECTSRSKAAELRERLDSCLADVRDAHAQKLVKRPQVDALDAAMTELNRQLCKVEARYGDDPEDFQR